MAEVVVRTLDSIAHVDLARLLIVGFESSSETGGDAFQRHAAFGTLRPGHGRHDVAEIEFQRVGEDNLGPVIVAPHALRLRIGFDERDPVGGAAGHGEIVDGFAVDREEAAGRTVFRAHVADCGTVGKRHVVETGAEEFDELRHDALLAQHLHDHQHEVGRGAAFLELAGQLEADDFGQEHGNRLAEHGSFGFDATDAPAENAKTVDHRRVAIGTDAGVGVSHRFPILFLRPDSLAEIFEVHLMTDTRARRNDAEILEGLLAPFEEAIAFAVALVFEFDVAGECRRRAEFVDDDRVIDHEVDGNQRVDLFRIATQRHHGIAHGGEIDHGGNAGEVLHQHAGRTVGDFAFSGALVDEPGGNAFDVLFDNRAAVFVAQQIFQDDLHGIRQLGNTGKAVCLSLGQAVVNIILSVHAERGTAIETVERFRHERPRF